MSTPEEIRNLQAALHGAVPPEVAATLREFATDSKSGQIVLEVKDGRVLKLTTNIARRVGV